MSDYPTSAELRKIRNWEIETPEKLMALLNYLKIHWQYGNCNFYSLKGKNVLQLRLSCAGSSGNEELIGALRKSLFWFCFWMKSERGGHYFFKINLKTFYPKRRG